MAGRTGKFEARMWAAGPEVRKVLQGADTFEAARRGLFEYLERCKRALRAPDVGIPSWEWEIADDCIDVLRNLFSRRYEEAAKFSALRALWRLARGKYPRRGKTLAPGFFEEFRHLFLGMAGKSPVYEGKGLPTYIALTGRKAALARSRELDQLAADLQRGLARFPSGLDEPLTSERRRNTRRVMKMLKASEEDWQDWRWQYRHVLRDRKALQKIITLSREEARAVDLAIAKNVPFGITPYYATLLRRRISHGGVHSTRAQVIPPLAYVQEMVRFRGRRDFACDFMLERDTSPVDLVTRRYPTIAILKPASACFQVCVYCQRNWEITSPTEVAAVPSGRKIDRALDWLAATPAIREVLVTGGDPLMLTDDRLAYILDRLAALPTLERIRVGTRTPVVAPMRLTQDLADLLASYNEPGRREFTVVTHFQHSAEITPEAMRAVRRLRRRGLSVYNQAVLTYANCRRFEMCKLRLDLRRIGIDPYYLFNAKAKEELDLYRVPLARLEQERKEEARLLSGLARTDAPVYNIPRLGKHNVIAWQHHRVIAILPDGRRMYEFQPWEKNIAPEEVFVEADVSLYDFLQYLKGRGENVRDYRTLWYYF